MTKHKNEGDFFNNLKNRMKSNADKMKQEKVIKEGPDKDRVIVEEKKLNHLEDKKSGAKIDKSVKSKKEIRRTYYLKKSIVNRIDSFAKKTGNNKSYLVELALSYFLNNPNIDENLVTKEDSEPEFNPSKLVIPNRKVEKKTRRTYYLKEDMIESLDSFADKSDCDKSFIVEKALKFLFDNAEVE